MHAGTYGHLGASRGTRRKWFWAFVVRFLPKAKRAATVAQAARDDDDAEFGWVPSWLSDPPPPTPAAMRGAETLRKLPTPNR
jgi:hypothetical protein